MHDDKRNLDSIPEGPLGIIPLASCADIGEAIDRHLVRWRCARQHEHENDITFRGYMRDSYVINAACARFGSGEAKGRIDQSIRNYDLYIMVDVTNYSMTYKLCGQVNRMSPDDHFQDLKRVIAATCGKAGRITVIMPFLYESRQHRRTARESLDCAMALQELINMGVDNIITFDAHDPRVQNAIPLNGFDTVTPFYQFVKGILGTCDDLTVDKDHLMIISPDEGATERAVFMASVLGVEMGMFYKRRDYSRVVDGMNPIVAHEFLGSSLEGKDVWVLDDMISSGGSMIDVARELKKRHAGRIFVIATFGLFTSGMEKFDKAVDEGLIYKVVSTNLTYQSPELLSRDYFISCDMSKYIAYIIDTLNHNASISDLLDPYNRIRVLVQAYNENRQLDEINEVENVSDGI
ncbi:MAG: ribose-phosphate pyrophosphokinase [Clostridiales bacterium]|nr:ribose-phosphate pyrophosphokinase [Clostridiales bacterium]